MPRTRRFRSLLLLAALVTFVAPAAAQEPPEPLAPFDAIRWSPEVRVDGRWLALRSINGVPVDEISAFAQLAYGDRWQRRIGEDLVELLAAMGHPVEATVTLTVRDPISGKQWVLEDVPMTAANRSAVRAARLALERGEHRAHAGPIELAEALHAADAAIDERWAYRPFGGADFDAAIAALRGRVQNGIGRETFAVELQRIVALGIDGHAGIVGFDLPAAGFLPLLVEPVDDNRFVAFQRDRTSLVANGLPFLTAIDGLPIEHWCDVALELVPHGSPQYRRHHCLRLLREITYLRQVTGREHAPTVDVELVSADGAARRTFTLPLAPDRPVYGTWPRGGSRMLDDNVGYLRLTAMDAGALREIDEWMPRLRKTAGLIIDVRDNGGGSRDALRLIYSYLVPPGAPPRVVNAAVHRLHPDHAPDHLASRHLFRADSEHWTQRQRAAIAAFAESFQPDPAPPADGYSDWHYMVLDRLPDVEIYHFDRPVMILMNAKCFSATDVFLSALKGLDHVTLLGTASGGGSARAETVPLGATGLEIRLATMISYQADGRLFDGVGVAPDIERWPEPAYFVGGRDTLLMEAVRRVLGR